MSVCPSWDKKCFRSVEALEAADRQHKIDVDAGREACICMTNEQIARYVARQERCKTWWGRLIDIWA